MDEGYNPAAFAQHANTVVAAHRRESGAPWRKVCVACLDDQCPELDTAVSDLADYRQHLDAIRAGLQRAR